MTEQVQGNGATAYAFANVLAVIEVIFNIFIFLPFLVFVCSHVALLKTSLTP
jgi:hypothetical protein